MPPRSALSGAPGCSHKDVVDSARLLSGPSGSNQQDNFALWRIMKVIDMTYRHKLWSDGSRANLVRVTA